MTTREHAPLFVLVSAIGAACGALGGCCPAWPIQITQTPQLESYTQRYTFCRDAPATRDRLDEQVLGPLEYSPDPLPFEKIIVRGSVYFRIMLTPRDRKHFFIEGLGWHKIFYGDVDPLPAQFRFTFTTEFPWIQVSVVEGSDADYRLLGTADYRVEDDGPIPITRLGEGFLTIRTKVSTTSWYHREARYLTTEIFIRVYLRELDDDVYTIDYGREHDIGIAVETNGHRRLVRPIGHMQFATPTDGRHILDVRDLDDIPLADYPATEAFEAAPATTTPIVEWIPDAPCQEPL